MPGPRILRPLCWAGPWRAEPQTPIRIQAGDPLEPPSPDGLCGGSNGELRWAVVRGLATGAPDAQDGWGGQPRSCPAFSPSP